MSKDFEKNLLDSYFRRSIPLEAKGVPLFNREGLEVEVLGARGSVGSAAGARCELRADPEGM